MLALAPTAFLVFPNFHLCFYKTIATPYTFSVSSKQFFKSILNIDVGGAGNKTWIAIYQPVAVSELIIVNQ